jgi:peroxiredoxin
MAINVGTHAPHVTLIDSDRKPVEFPKHGEVTVLVFVPAAFTSVCTKELCTFRDSIGELNSLNAKVYGISVDSPFALAAWKKEQGLTFPLLADFKHAAIKAYDIVFPNLANIGYECAQRSVFVVGKDGHVAWSWISNVPTDEPNYDDVKKAVAAASK